MIARACVALAVLGIAGAAEAQWLEEPDSGDACLEDCRIHGECTLVACVGLDRCVASSNEDCRQSKVCSEAGRCTVDVEGGECVAGGPEDCRTSRRCVRDGKGCRYDPEAERCDEGYDRLSMGAAYAGIAHMGLGAAGIIGALVGSVAGYGSGDDTAASLLTALLVQSTISLTVVGPVLVSVGMVKVERAGAAPALLLAPGGGSLRWRF